MLTVDRDTLDALDFDLDRGVANYQAALAEHAMTEGIPAPAAHPLVEQIVRGHGGAYRAVEHETASATADPDPRVDASQAFGDPFDG